MINYEYGSCCMLLQATSIWATKLHPSKPYPKFYKGAATSAGRSAMYLWKAEVEQH